MESRFDIVGLGELLIDFTDAGVGENGIHLFEQNPGGAPANLLTTVSHMGLSTAFIGKVGDDMHGHFLIDTLKNQGICTESIIVDSEVFTTLAFVGVDVTGERSFSFARKPGADTMLRKEELNNHVLENTKIFHIGSLSLTDEPARGATYEAVRLAKQAGALISYDPNYRESLWKSRESAIKEMKKMIPNADLLKVSDEESELLTKTKDYESAAGMFLEQGPEVVAITMGNEGVYIATENCRVFVPAYRVEAVDTTGAGDSFWGGFLSLFVKSQKRIEKLTEKDLICFGKFANATASLCVQKRGGIPAIPYEEEVEKIIAYGEKK